MAKTIAQALIFAEDKLKDALPEAKREGVYILSHALNWPMTKLIAYPDYQLTNAEADIFDKLLERRKLGEPFAYIKKSKFFWDLVLEVNPSVLIPRPETELLVETILSLDLSLSIHPKVLDLGTGSGAIAVSLASCQPNWSILATDMSEQALTTAKNNANHYKLNNIKFHQGNWYEGFSDKFDVIVSNPPYISSDSDYLNEGDVRFEPQTALVADKNGLADLEHIILNGPKYIKLDGYLLVEHGYDQGDRVKALFGQAGFIDVQTLQDIQGLDRVTFGKYPSP